MMVWDVVSAVLILGGCFFFLAGTVGLLRFPTVYARLHALTKADNLGLGLVVIGLIPQAGSWTVSLKMLLVWGLALIASVCAAHVVARAALRDSARGDK